MIRQNRLTSFGTVLIALSGSCFVGCSEDGTTTGENAASTESALSFEYPQEPIDLTLAPVRTLGTPGNVYIKAFSETLAATGTFAHSVYVYQPDSNGEPIAFHLAAKDSAGVVDSSHSFQSVVVTSHPGASDESRQTLPGASGQRIFALPSSIGGWYQFTFVYHAPNANRTLSFKAVDGAGNALKTLWVDPANANAQVVATVVAGAQAQSFLKGGTYGNATSSQYAYIDNIKVDGNLLYQRSFDQGLFNFPLGQLAAAEHVVEFSFAASNPGQSYRWFGVNTQSFDPAGAKQEWAASQVLYTGTMHTGDYDAWNEGVAFAQGPVLNFGVRPPPVRRGTFLGLALEHASLRGTSANATVRVYPVGSGTATSWSIVRANDYSGGVMAPGGVSRRYRETWLVNVPSDAPVGRYVVRATSPTGVAIGQDVLLYVIHNPYTLMQSGALSKAELETYAYDEDEDGMGLFSDFGPDSDHARDHFTTQIEPNGDGDVSILTLLTAAFRRTQEATAYSMLDYVVAAMDGTTSEIDSMRRLFRVGSQGLYYTRPSHEGDASNLLGVANSPIDYFLPSVAAIAAQPGYLGVGPRGGECFDYAFLLASLARTSGVPVRVVSGGGVGGFGHHQFVEAFMPNLPLHGGQTSPTGGTSSDQDPWYVFDSTSPFVNSAPAETGFAWYTHGETISPRSMYGMATTQIQPSDAVNRPIGLYVPDVDWTPHYDNWTPNGQSGESSPSEVIWVDGAYSSGPERWLTQSGARGYIGFSDKDIYRVRKEVTGASSVRVRLLPSGGEVLRPVVCVASASLPEPAFPEMCDNPSETALLPPGDSYVVVFNGVPNIAGDRILRGDSIQYELTLEGTPAACNEATAIDMGAPGTNVTVANNSCLKVTQYPSWWGVRPLQLQNTSPGVYPVPFNWSNCGTTTGSNTITQDWQSLLLNNVNDDCPTFVKLNGSGQGSVTLRYYAN